MFSVPFGLMLGSFLNVVIFRVPRNCMSIVRPRSRCTRCLQGIAWYDNIPVVSYLLLGGKCRRCGQSISVRYPLVELLTGLMMFACAYQWLVVRWGRGYDEFEATVGLVAQMYVVAALIAASFIDLDFRILPHEITLSGIVISIVAVTAFPWLHRGESVVELLARSGTNAHLAAGASAVFGAFIGGGMVYFVRVVGSWVFRKEAMGMGDVWYFAFLGGYLGSLDILIAFVLACFFGAFIGSLMYFITKDRYIPFGPFLSLGVLAMIFFSDQVQQAIHWYQGLMRPG